MKSVYAPKLSPHYKIFEFCMRHLFPRVIFTVCTTHTNLSLPLLFKSTLSGSSYLILNILALILTLAGLGRILEPLKGIASSLVSSWRAMPIYRIGYRSVRLSL